MIIYLNKFNIRDDAQKELNSMVENLKIGGLGIHFMRKLMDEVTYQFNPTTGNTLIMVKNF